MCFLFYLFIENLKIFFEDIKEYLNKWTKILYPWIEKLNIKPISHGPKFNYTLMQFQPKPQWFFLWNLPDSKINMEGQVQEEQRHL